MPSRPRFSLEINWKSRFARGSPKDHSLSPTNHDTTRKPFLEYYDSCFSQNTIQNMKNIQLFLRSCSSCLCSFIFTDPARTCDVTMSHTWIYSWYKIKVVFFNIFIYFCSFRSFRWFRFGRFVSLFRVLVHASLESTQEARVALGCASSNSYASFVLSKLPACIHNSIYAR